MNTSTHLKKNYGILITFEGTEGSGKSTLIKKLAELLESHLPDYPVVCTREPGGIFLSEKIRELLLHQQMHPKTELFLYEAARCEHLHQLILPALKEGKIVLCDRFTDSSLAYQSHARGLPWKEVHQLNQIATQKLKPHLTILLDIDPANGLNRAQNPNRFEAEGLKFQLKVREGYLKALSKNKKRWFKISVDHQTPDELAQKVFSKILKKFFKQNISFQSTVALSNGQTNVQTL